MSKLFRNENPVRSTAPLKQKEREPRSKPKPETKETASSVELSFAFDVKIGPLAKPKRIFTNVTEAEGYERSLEILNKLGHTKEQIVWSGLV